jgi:hypothetical protein
VVDGRVGWACSAVTVGFGLFLGLMREGLMIGWWKEWEVLAWIFKDVETGAPIFEFQRKIKGDREFIVIYT